MIACLRSSLCYGLSLAPLLSLVWVLPSQAAEPLDFNRDIRPILSNHCWNCHGRDDHARQANLRLDRRDDATKKLESGSTALVPGDVSASELVMRIEASDADTIMPPPDFKRPLTAKQRETLKQWIAQGAPYANHWAFETPKRPVAPAVRNTAWPRNEIDRFVLAKLEAEGIAPSPEADRRAWLRRVTLDLTGLPPTLEELNAFEADNSPKAYEKVVDRLLSSPRYAERMAQLWLDAARFADTNGYNNDEMRTMWPWRDYVIRAFAANMPFDQFVTEQIAGDLLPSATVQQRVATGFNRNHVLTTEGGIIEEEYHVEYVADRIHTTSTVFLGLSMQCARCHDHKYDPLTQREYYQMAAFFNNVPDRIVGYNKGRMAEPLLKVPSPEQESQLAALNARKSEVESALGKRATELDADLAKWESEVTPEKRDALGSPSLLARFSFDGEQTETIDSIDPQRKAVVDANVTFTEGKSGKAAEFRGGHLTVNGLGDFEADQPFSFAAWVNWDGGGAMAILSKIDEAAAYRGYDMMIEGGKIACHVVNHWPDSAFKVESKVVIPTGEWHHVAATYDGSRVASGYKLYIDAKPVELEATTNNRVEGSLKTDKFFHIGKRQNSNAFFGKIDDVQVFANALSLEDVARVAAGEPLATVKDLLAKPAAQRSEEEKVLLRRWFFDRADPVAKSLREELASLPGKIKEVDDAIPVTMVMVEEQPRRPSYLLKRGAYDARGEQVPANVPASLLPFPENAPDNRLGFAKWLIDQRHPLTARVAVNRWWEMYFGTGIVETTEDFGVQGAYPSHPELLDWLANELAGKQWNVRNVLKQIALSATYRQSSHVRRDLAERDPDNRLLARGPRFRLSAEAIRDGALHSAGLLSDKIGGPSVKPYQPEGLWEDVSVERREKYVPDDGDGIYRRGMYTFWKRTCPPPSMTTFDAPDRETCLVRRARTNTPLQALVLLNDPTYVEAARKLADRAMAASPDDGERARQLFRMVLTRNPTADEVKTIAKMKQTALAKFTAAPPLADKLLQVGRAARDDRFTAPEAAAWTTVASAVLNLSEAVTKP